MSISLADLLPRSRKVQTSAGELELHGLGLAPIAKLLMAFPSLQNLFVVQGGAPTIAISELVNLAPEAIAGVIAEAARKPGDTDEDVEASIQAVANGGLLFEEQADCLLVIKELTMPNGPAPLLASLRKLLGDEFVDHFGTDGATNMPKPPNSSLPPDTAFPT